MPEIGQNLAHYRIVEKIGKGGMGEVFRAKDQKLGRDVAIKVLPEEFAKDADRVSRFQREAKLLASLNHPNIAAIHGLEEAEGINFLVLELVEGETLADRIKANPIPVEESLKLALQIAEALEAAHEKGVIHRDLKPANIKITPNGKVKVLDFGLAKQLMPVGKGESQVETLSNVTQSGTIAGTFPYMSPEQLQGKLTDARSDLFSFGTVFYEMLTGVHPFSRASAMETASAILSETPLPLDRHKRGIPGQLQDIVERMLAKDPVQRYQNAHEVYSDLSQMLVDGRAASTAGRRFRWIWVAVAFIVIVLGVAPVTWWVRQNYFKSPQAALAFQERDWILIADVENLTGDPVFDRSLQTAMTVGIQQSKYVNVIPPTRVLEALGRMRKDSGVKLDEALSCEIAMREDVKAVLAFSISNIGNVYSLTARLVEPSKRAIVMGQTANASGKDQILSTLDSMMKSIRQSLGESLSSMSSQSLALPKATTSSLEALKTYADFRANRQAGLDLLNRAVEIDPDFALAHADLGVAWYSGGGGVERSKGEEHFKKALSLMNRLTLRESLWIRAVVEDCRGNADGAAECYGAFLAHYPDDRDGWSRLGWLQMARRGQYEKAIEALKRVLGIDSSDSTAYINIATCYTSLRQDEKAKENFEKGFELSPSDLLGYNVNSEYGFTIMRLGDLQKAAETFQKMISADEMGKKPRGYRSMAFLAMYQGKLSDAIANFKRAISLNKTVTNSASEFRDHLFLASVYRLKGRNADFLSELTMADRILSQEPLDPGFISELAVIYARTGKTREASRLLNDMTSQAKNLTATSYRNRTDKGDQASISQIKGELALANGKVAEAIECFELMIQLEPRYSAEPLAVAYRKSGKLQDAADKYEEIIARSRRNDALLEQWILTHYELAKICKELGNTQKAKEYYVKFLNIWKDADPDIPILENAKAEYAALQ